MEKGRRIIGCGLALSVIFGLTTYEAVSIEEAMRANGLVSPSNLDTSKITETKTIPFAKGFFWR